MVTINDIKKLIAAIEPLEEPRKIKKKVQHPLNTLINSAIIATLCGCDTWDEIEGFVYERQDWFNKLLHFPNGTPSHDTYNRLFSLVDPQLFQKCFEGWVQALIGELDLEDLGRPQLAIDGKTVRRSQDIKKGKGPLHIVSVWSSTLGIVLGQRKTDEKSNEITAIPELLNSIDIKNSVVTIDAMGCQKKIAKVIKKKGGDYIFGLKGNQSISLDLVKDLFEYPSNKHFKYSTSDERTHGRSEERIYFASDDLNKDILMQIRWPGLGSVVMLESQRMVDARLTKEKRYYLTSLPPNEVELIGKSIRAHWGIENTLHWTLDVVFREDECRKRNRYAAQNFSLVRKFALNLLKIRQKTYPRKRSLRIMRKMCGWNPAFLLETAGFTNQVEKN